MAVIGLALGLVVSVGALVSTSIAGPRGPVTEPIHSPMASVAPEVAQEMNGPKEKVKVAKKIKMHPPKKIGRYQLLGRGQGNGCLKWYGEPGQCLPMQSPAQAAMPTMKHPWTCPEVRELFPDGITVLKKDKLRLDKNGDGVACGPGDG